MLKIPFLSDRHDRTLGIRRNIALSFILQGASTILGFVQIPLILSYVDQSSYGIWITLTSLLSFLYLVDMGIGYGLRNRLAESVAKGKYRLARMYVSTTYVLGGLFVIGILGLFFLVRNKINWASVFNAPPDLSSQVGTLVLIAFSLFCLFMILKLVTTILIALQKPAFHNLQLALTSLVNLAFVIVLIKTTEPSLITLGFALSLSPLVVLTGFTIFFFRGPLRQFAPSLKYVRLSAGRHLVGLGMKFFVIQMASIVIFQTHNILISHFMSPAQVTPYNLAYRYFGVANVGFSLVMLPFWSAFTDAFTKRDFGWIKASLRGLIKLWVVFSGILLGLLLISKGFFNIWLGDKVAIPFSLSAALCVYFIIYLWGSIFISFINGIGKINTQFYTAIICIILNVPLAFLFSRVLGLGLVGIVITACVMNIFGLLLAPLQTLKVLKADYGS